MTPIELYQSDMQEHGFCHDLVQERAVQEFQRLYHDLTAADRKRSSITRSIILKAFCPFKRTNKQPCRGLYLWGGVGRGKTWLVDLFYRSLPFPDKMRTHFHRFIKRIHDELRTLDGQKNPLVIVAERLAKEARVICFDEFFVADITDAMILATLLDQLFKNGVTLVATSNIVPDELYKDGLQRDKFLPAIALIHKYLDVVNVDSGVDYRLRTLEQAQLYHYPLNNGAMAAMANNFLALVADQNQILEEGEVVVERRAIPVHRMFEDVVWFRFSALCDGPRSQNDYIQLAKEFHTVLISDVPQMGRATDDQARRFINMIDEFYDRGVKVIMSGAVPLLELYTEGGLAFEFQRTLSRLQEMQSHDYLAREHKP